MRTPRPREVKTITALTSFTLIYLVGFIFLCDASSPTCALSQCQEKYLQRAAHDHTERSITACQEPHTMYMNWRFIVPVVSLQELLGSEHGRNAGELISTGVFQLDRKKEVPPVSPIPRALENLPSSRVGGMSTYSPALESGCTVSDNTVW